MGRRERGSSVMRVCGQTGERVSCNEGVWQTGERVFCDEGVGRRERGSSEGVWADRREGLQ